MCLLSKKYLTCIPHEHKPFWQLSWFGDLAISRKANLFVHVRLQNVLPRIFCILLGKEVLWEKNGKIKGWSFINLCWNVPEQTSALIEKNFYVISLNNNWLKFLFITLLKAKKRKYLLVNKELSEKIQK